MHVMITQKKVCGFSGAHAQTTGVVKVLSWDSRLRWIRALKTAALLYIAMLVSVFIPGLHFILVPVLFLLAPLSAIYIFLQKSVVASGSITCPACHKAIAIIRSKDEWPLHIVCSECKAFVRLERID